MEQGKTWLQKLRQEAGKVAELQVYGGLAGLVLLAGLLLFLKLLPKSFGFREGNLLGLLALDGILCLSLGIRWKLPWKWEGALGALWLFGAPALCFYHMEYLQENPIRSMEFLMVFFNYIFYLFLFLLLYLVSNRIRIAVPVGMGLVTFYSLANRFICLFRGNGIRSYDIYAFRTAMNVAENYELVFSQRMVQVILGSLALMLLSVKCRWKDTRVKARLATDAGILALIFAVCHGFFDKTFLEVNYITPYKWELQKSAAYHGSFLDFVAGLAYLGADKPEGYSEKKAQEIQEAALEEGEGLKVATELEGQKPDIIVIMNESFSDLDVLGELETTQEELSAFYGQRENTIHGTISVPVYGGLTANTEFEFLTGYSNAFFPSGIIAYQAYVKDDTPNLGRQLSEEGYHTIFMHPFARSGWNRSNVYQMFGFDEIYFEDDFTYTEEKDRVRGYVSDSANYKEIIKRYEEAKEREEQVFLFNVTMQNHGGYETGAIEKSVQIKGEEGSYPKAEEYLSLMKASDTAFAELAAYFTQVEEPVLVCFFGDHQPIVEEELVNSLLEKGGGTEIEQLARKYQTPFVLFANYDLEEKEYENISVNYLSSLLLEAAGLPLNEYQEYLERLYEVYPVVNLYGVKDSQGNWSNWEEAGRYEEIVGYQMVQYQALFG